MHRNSKLREGLDITLRMNYEERKVVMMMSTTAMARTAAARDLTSGGAWTGSPMVVVAREDDARLRGQRR